MTDKQTQAGADTGNMEKDPDDWVTGDEPMTGAQRSYLKTLSEEAHVDFDENLTKADASRRIDELQQMTGRGRGGGGEGGGHGGGQAGSNQGRSGHAMERHEREGTEPANPGSAGPSGDEATTSIGPE
jgi:hypothetical protein